MNAEFEPYLYACQDADIDFTTMREFGDTAACRRALYELNKTCAADIPERGRPTYLNEASSTRTSSIWLSGSQPLPMTRAGSSLP